MGRIGNVLILPIPSSSFLSLLLRFSLVVSLTPSKLVSSSYGRRRVGMGWLPPVKQIWLQKPLHFRACIIVWRPGQWRGVPEDLYLGWENTVRHLTRRGQTRKRSLDPRWPLVTPKVQVIIATWNVRTLNKVGKTAQFTTEMRKYVTDILGISECRSVLDSSEQSLVIQFFTPEEMMPLIMVGWHLRWVRRLQLVW